MADSAFLLLNISIASCLDGAIWLHHLGVFPSWKLISPSIPVT
jgi:hypothetical protein